MGGCTGNKVVLASRLETVLSLVLKRMHGDDEQLLEGEEPAGDYEDDMEEAFEAGLVKPREVTLSVRPGEMPADVRVDAAQAESALGFVLADVIDAEAEDDLEADIRAEKEAMRDCEINPAGASYSCLSFSIDTACRSSLLYEVIEVVLFDYWCCIVVFSGSRTDIAFCLL